MYLYGLKCGNVLIVEKENNLVTSSVLNEIDTNIPNQTDINVIKDSNDETSTNTNTTKVASRWYMSED